MSEIIDEQTRSDLMDIRKKIVFNPSEAEQIEVMQGINKIIERLTKAVLSTKLNSFFETKLK